MTLRFTAQQLEAARAWIADCVWRDLHDESDIAALTPEQIERGVEQHYDGGRRQFIVDGEPM